MRGNYGIYLDFVNGNHYKAVFTVSQTIPNFSSPQPMPVFSLPQRMPFFASFRVLVPNVLAGFVNNVAPPLNLDSVIPAKRPCERLNTTQNIHHKALLYCNYYNIFAVLLRRCYAFSFIHRTT